MRGAALALLACGLTVGTLFWVSNRSARAPVASVPSVVRSTRLDIYHSALREPKQVKVNQGDTLRLLVTSDEADELHVHGYDLHLPLKPGKTQILSFVAAHTGRFPIELHRADVELVVLEVYPRGSTEQ